MLAAVPTLTAAGLRALDDVVAAAAGSGAVPGVVCGVATGDQVHVVAAGSATTGSAPMTRSTIVRIASLTKPMTAVCVLSLVADGLVALDDPVDRWLPELADRRVLRRPDGPLDDTVAADRPITVRDLLTNTTGIGMDGAMFTAPQPWPLMTAAAPLHTLGPPQLAATPDPDTWIAVLGELPLLAQPGAKWLYQTSSAVQGVLVRRVTGRPFEDVLRERVLAPLGMSDTAFWTPHVDRLATAYRGDGEVVDPPDGQWSSPPEFPDGGGGLVSTVDDVLAFGRLLLRHGAGVLPAGLAAEMVRDQLTAAQRANDWGGFSFLGDRSWGYGLSVTPDRHGWEGGSGTSWCNVPELDLTVVTLTQQEFGATGPPPVLEDAIAAARAAVA